jgi:maleylacetate reductase
MSGADGGTFVYANPMRIHWGAGVLEARLDEELLRLGAQRVFVITTRSVYGKAELFGRVAEHLGARLAGAFPAIGQHAPAATVAAAVDAARGSRADVLVSFGGGSPIDATKAVAFALATGLDLRQPDAAVRARAFAPKPHEMLPHVAVPTTLSAAELSGLAGFTTEDEHEKVGLRGVALIPSAVIFDAQLSLETPLELWLSTGIRAVDHAVETVVASENHPLSDVLALEALSRLQRSLLVTRAEPNDLAARTDSQLGAWFSFTLPGPAASGLSHTLGKRIGSRHNIPQG